ncbi:hypothetical protein HanRHA438_Chr09g0429701 [Helianthus annuus]|nr:hypothetical protein HanIR_Chr09g0450031 [Helianthus annuus]KAJ0890974.1 hypothetical protein HanRHA438_Chr09g0429701 [Helianthus annuus]
MLINAFEASPSIIFLSSMSLPLNATLVESKKLHKLSTFLANPVSNVLQLLQLQSALLSFNITPFGSRRRIAFKNSVLLSGLLWFRL